MKLKTHKATAKRVRVTKNGKIIHGKAGWGHLKSKKDARIKYRKRLSKSLDGTRLEGIKRALPGVF